MNSSNISFESELQISAKPVAITLIVLDILYILTINPALTSSEQFQETVQGILLLCLPCIAWRIEDQHSKLGRWLVITTVAGFVFFISARYASPVFLSLMVIPVSLAVSMIGVSAAKGTAIVITPLMIASIYLFPSDDAVASVATAVVAMWAMLGIWQVVYSLLENVTQWTSEYYRHAYAVYEEAQESRVELGQALEDLVYANRQLALVNKRIGDYRLIAEQALQAKSAFVAKVSHEFRTPLNIIIGLVELMVDSPEIYNDLPSADMHNDLRVIYRNSEHLSDMINDVLDLARTEVGYLTLHRERQDMQAIIESAMIAVRPLLANKQLSWKISTPTNLPEVYCDGIRIEQVILNLVSNAARHTDKGGVFVKAHQQDQSVVVSVTDTGSGIAPEDVKRIFEPFLQASAYPRYDRESSGLGLSISKEIVELHGGRLWVESKQGVGSTFSFELPISPPLIPDGKPGNQILPEYIWSEPRSHIVFPDSHYKPRLVLFDERDALFSMLSHFSDEVELVHARSMCELNEAMRESPAQALIINSDTREDIFHRIENVKPLAPDTPILVCSVSSKTIHADTAGVRGYLTKPVTRSALTNAIQTLGKPIRRVLVVDDDPNVQTILNRMLLVYDNTMDITTVSDGRQALAELRREPPDLMLLDIVLPDMDGWQVLKTVRQDERIREVTTLVVSAQDPMGTTLTSDFLLVSVGEGLSLSRLLSCSLETSALLLKP